MFPPKPLDIFSPEGGCSEGLDASGFFSNNNNMSCVMVYYIVSVLFFLFFWCLYMAINVKQYLVLWLDKERTFF